MSVSSPVEVRLVVGGVEDVRRAFKSIMEIAEQCERATTSKLGTESKRRVSTFEKEAKKRTDLTRGAMNKASEIMKRFGDQESQFAKVSRDASNTWHRGWSAAFSKTASEAARSSENVRRSWARLADAKGIEGLREGVRNLTKDVAAYERVVNKAGGGGGRGGRSLGSTVGSALGSVLNGATRVAGTAAALGGGFSLADAVQRGLSAEAASVALANSMYNPSDAEQKGFLKGGRFDKSKILSLAGKAQASSGVDKAEFLKGVGDYVAKSSDWKAVATEEGQGTLLELAKLAKATGSDFGQVMGAAGAMRTQNANLTPEAMMKLMYGVVGQSKLGAVEMKDLATSAAVITSASGSFGTGKGGYADQASAQAGLLGLSQLAMQTSGSSSEAATSVKAFAADLNAHGAKAEGTFAGLKLFDENHKLLKSSTLLENIFQATGGRADLMGQGPGHLGLGREAIHVAQSLQPVFDDAFASAKAGGLSAADARKAAAKAVGAKVRTFENASYSKDDSDKDLQEVLSTKKERFNRAITHLLEIVEARATPFVEKLASALERNEPRIEKGLNMIADVAGMLADNPVAGLGAVLAASVAAEVAKAKLGTVLGGLLTGGGGGAGGAGGAGLLGGLGAGGVAVGGAAVVATAANLYFSKKAYDAGDAGWQQAGKDMDAAKAAFAGGDADSIRAAQQSILKGQDASDPLKMLQGVAALPAFVNSTALSAITGGPNTAANDITSLLYGVRSALGAEDVMAAYTGRDGSSGNSSVGGESSEPQSQFNEVTQLGSAAGETAAALKDTTTALQQFKAAAEAAAGLSLADPSHPSRGGGTILPGR